MLLTGVEPDLFERLLQEKIVIFDGGMGTSLQATGPSADDFRGNPGVYELLVLSRPDLVQEIHASFINAGADIIETNTFCASSLSLKEHGLQHLAADINRTAARLAREVARDFKKNTLVAGSLGPTSHLPSLGHVTYACLKASYEQQVEVLITEGCDILIFETCQDVLQIRAAVAAADTVMKKLRQRLPLVVQFTIDEKGRTLLGSEPEAILCVLESLPVAMTGINCGVGPGGMVEPMRTISGLSTRPVSCQPNAGLPELVDDKTVFTLGPQEFARRLAHLARETGLNAAGGCCGTRPEHIAALSSTVANISPRTPAQGFPPSISSIFSMLSLDAPPKPLLVAEEMNSTTRRKKFRCIVREHDKDRLREVAQTLEDEGAQVLDLCVATVDGNEQADMAWAVESLGKTLHVPLFIDTTEPKVVDAAGRTLPGKFVVNSVNLERGEDHLKHSLETARTHGAAVLAMTLDEQGIAIPRERKIEIADRLHSLAVGHCGFPERDLMFDPLTLPLGTGSSELRGSAQETLEAITLLKQKYPSCLIVLGVSNISFGLSKTARKILNSVFLWEAVRHGLDIAIISRKKLLRPDQIDDRSLNLALDLIYPGRSRGIDALSVFNQAFPPVKKGEVAPLQKPVAIERLSPGDRINKAVLAGTAAGIEEALKECLVSMMADEILNAILLKAMNEVGSHFEKGHLQLPSVLASAEVVKKSFDFLRGHLDEQRDSTGIARPAKIVLGTVKGDVHDIGKNLVDMVLSSSGITVVNIGVKQTSEQILKAAEETGADVVGLSGLLTRSVMEMEQVLKEFQARGITIPFILGGAALRRSYVENKLRTVYDGPVFYARDALDGLKIVQFITNPATREKARVEGSTSTGKTLKDPVHITSEQSSAKPESIVPASVPRLPHVPRPPYFGRKILESVDLVDAFELLDENHLMRFHWKTGDTPVDKKQAARRLESMKQRMLDEAIVEARAVCGYFRCHSRNNTIYIYEQESSLPAASFTFPESSTARRLSLPRLFLSGESSTTDAMYDVLPLFVVTVGQRPAEFLNKLKCDDRFRDYFHWHGFFAQLAEALAERLNRQIVEELSIPVNDPAMRWRRFSFGYPACPDLSNQKELFTVLKPEEIGIRLSETFQMIPEHSVSALLARVVERSVQP